MNGDPGARPSRAGPCEAPPARIQWPRFNLRGLFTGITALAVLFAVLGALGVGVRGALGAFCAALLGTAGGLLVVAIQAALSKNDSGR